MFYLKAWKLMSQMKQFRFVISLYFSIKYLKNLSKNKVPIRLIFSNIFDFHKL